MGGGRYLIFRSVGILEYSALAQGNVCTAVGKDHTESVNWPWDGCCDGALSPVPMLASIYPKSSSILPRFKSVSNSFGGVAALVVLAVMVRSPEGAGVE